MGYNALRRDGQSLYLLDLYQTLFDTMKTRLARPVATDQIQRVLTLLLTITDFQVNPWL